MRTPLRVSANEDGSVHADTYIQHHEALFEVVLAIGLIVNFNGFVNHQYPVRNAGPPQQDINRTGFTRKTDSVKPPIRCTGRSFFAIFERFANAS